LGVEEEVFQLEVMMADAIRMAMGKGVEHLYKQLLGRIFVEVSLFLKVSGQVDVAHFQHHVILPCTSFLIHQSNDVLVSL